MASTHDLLDLLVGGLPIRHLHYYNHGRHHRVVEVAQVIMRHYRRCHFHRHQYREEKPVRLELSDVHVHLHIRPGREVQNLLDEIVTKLGRMEINIMTTVEEYAAQAKAAQDETDAKLEAVGADVRLLMEKLAAIPVAGLTPEQEALLTDVVNHAKAISEKVGAIDELNPPTA